jgi:hypothetical protein
MSIGCALASTCADFAKHLNPTRARQTSASAGAGIRVRTVTIADNTKCLQRLSNHQIEKSRKSDRRFGISQRFQAVRSR